MVAQKIGGRFIHLPDIHMNTDLLDAVADLMDTRTAANNKIHYDAIFSPGDFIESTKLTTESFGGVLNTYVNAQTQAAKAREDDFNTARDALFQKAQANGYDTPEKIQKAIEQGDTNLQNEVAAIQKIQAEIGKDALTRANKGGFTLDSLDAAITAEYTKLKPTLENLATKAPIVAVMGNHDTLHGYNVLDKKHEGPIKFVEYDRRAGVNIQGKNGKDWFIQGDTNTYERPTLAGIIEKLCVAESKDSASYLINYVSGFTTNEDSAGSKNPTNYLASKDANIARQMQSYAMFQRMRLDNTVKDAQGNPKAPDLYLTHKATKHGHFGTGDIAAEYGAKSRGVLSGHHHMPQIGNLHGNEIFKALNASTETTTIDGFDEEIKVAYFDDDNGIPQLNAGDNLVYEVIYDEDKKFKEVIIYKAIPTYEAA